MDGCMKVKCMNDIETHKKGCKLPLQPESVTPLGINIDATKCIL